ncbi:Protein ENHANCED DISEASE RESISTANCE 2 [Linum perenne]
MEGAAITETEVTVRKARGGSIGSEKEMFDGGGSSSGSGSSGKTEDKEKGAFEYFGWIYHLGTNSIGHEYCHLRFLFIRGKYVEMYKRDPHENPGLKPIRRGIVGPTLMVEELGRRKVNHGDVYVIRFYSRLDETKKGEIACATAGEARKWMEAFDHAKQQAELELSSGRGHRSRLSIENEINLESHRPKMRRYAHGLKRLIRIGQGPETLLRQASTLVSVSKSEGFFEAESEDVIDIHQWRCVRTIDGVRIFEDVATAKSDKGTLVKAVGVVDASADTVFEVFLNLDQLQRYEWDTLTGDLELLDSYDGHYDVLYGTYDPKYLTSWEIRNLSPSTDSNTARCLVSQMLEINQAGWFRWKQNRRSDFEKTTPYAMLTQVAGLKEYIGASPALRVESSTTVLRTKSSISSIDFDDEGVNDEFYDATDGESSSDEEEGDIDGSHAKKDGSVKLKNVSWAIASLALKKASAPDANETLDPDVPSISIEASEFNGSLHKGKDEKDSNCWTSPNGSGFKIRGRTYLKDNSKVVGGDPLLELIAVDWFKVDRAADGVARHPECLLQTEAGKKLPFVLVINLQIPAKPNYSLVLYFAADRPVNKESLLGKFIDGTDMFRDSRFKLIPSIVEGYWMVKRAVGTKACLLGKAVTCKYLRQDNFLEIDVDIGSSSVARSVIGLVLGYVTSLVVDLAILVEGKEESELPEFILGTVRLNKLKLETAVPLEV